MPGGGLAPEAVNGGGPGIGRCGPGSVLPCPGSSRSGPGGGTVAVPFDRPGIGITLDAALMARHL